MTTNYSFFCSFIYSLPTQQNFALPVTKQTVMIHLVWIKMNPKFSKQGQMVRKFPGESSRKTGILVEFLKSERFNRKFRKFLYET